MALLGKISAVLSANTQDFTRNLGTAKKELSDFAKRVRGIELNINTRALDGTLTKLQKFQRTVQEIAGLQAKGIDLGIDPRKLEDQFRVFEDIGKPLTKLVGQIEGLSTNLQAGLYPALGQVQRGFQDIYRAIQNGEPLSNFTRKIDDLRGRLVSLSRVTAASADLGKLVQSLDADNVGASFAQPFAKSALQKSLELRAQAEKTPARFRANGVFAELASDAERGAVRIERAAAKVFEIQLEIANNGPSTGRKQALAGAQEQLNALVKRQEAINRLMQTELRSVEIKRIVSPEAESQVDSLTVKFSDLVAKLREAGDVRFEKLISSVGRVVEQLNRGEISAKKAKLAVDALSAANSAKQFSDSGFKSADRLLRTDSERQIEEIRKNAESMRSAARLRASSAGRRSSREYINQLDYRDVTGVEVEPSASAKKYAKALAGQDSRDVEMVSKFLRDQFDKAMASVRMEPSRFGQSQTWSKWDIGKQLSMLANPSESSSKYRLADPLRDQQLQQEMVQRMVGWEIARASGAGKMPSSDELTRMGADALRSVNFEFDKSPELQKRRRRRVGGYGFANFTEEASLAREEFNRTVAERVSKLSRRAGETKDAGLTSQADDLRRLSVDANKTLKAAFDSTDAAARSQALDNYKAKFEALVPAIDRFEKKLKSAETARKRFDQFLEISGSRSDKLGADLERGASDIRVARQFAGNFDAGNIAGRRGVSAEIERQIGVYQRLSEFQQRIFDRDFKNEGARLKAIQKVTAAVESQRTKLRDTVVAESGGAVTAGRFDAAAERAAKNRGSFGVPGAAAAQLAIQQGLFAIDDLISSTGGLEYKLRAVGNNITQLGLLLGQSGLISGLNATTGLFIGLAAVVGGQVVSSILRFAFDTEAAEQKVKSLNSALSAQQSLFRSLASEYASFADSFRSAVQSPIGQADFGLEDTIKRLQKLRREVGEESAAATNPEIARLRADTQIKNKQLEESSSIPERVRLQREIEQNRRREEQIRSRLAGEANGADAAASIRKSAADAASAAARAFAGTNNPFAGVDEAVRVAAKKASDDAQLALKEFGNFANFDINNTQAAGQALAALRKQIENLSDLRGSAGVQGRAGLEAEIDKLIEGLLLNASRLEARLAGAFDQIDASLSRTATYAARSLDSAQQNIAAAFDRDISSSAIRAEIDSLSEALADARLAASRAATPDEAAAFQADIDAINEHARQLLSASLVIRRFADEFARASQSVASDASSVEQRADKARRDDIRRSTPDSRSARAQAEDDARRTRDEQRQFENDVATARERAERRILDEQDKRARRIVEINNKLAVPAGGVGADGTQGGSVDERQAMRAERARLESEIQSEIDASQEVAAVNRRRDEITRQREQADSIDRGRELSMTEGEKAGRDLAQQIQDIREYASRAAEESSGLPEDVAKIRDKMSKSISEAENNMARRVAPAVFALSDAVQNAILQGPSRAALNAADVTTMEGSRELNRLLRGDDPAKDVNLLELQKQTKLLEEAVETLKDGPQIAP